MITFTSVNSKKVTILTHFKTIVNRLLGETEIGMALYRTVDMVHLMKIDKSTFFKYPTALKLVLIREAIISDIKSET